MRKLLVALAVAGLVTPAIAADVTVAVTSIVEHPALNAARDGIKEALEAAGFKDGANGFHFVFETAQGKPDGGGDVSGGAPRTTALQPRFSDDGDAFQRKWH